MNDRNGWKFALLISVVLPLLAATAVMAAGGGKSIGKPSGVIPATLEHIEGSDIVKVTLTERAAQRIDLQTGLVQEELVKGSTRMVVPYSSLIYDPHGRTWIYTSPKPLTFVRTRVEVDFIQGDQVVLKKGPPLGTVVATVGVAELYGTEFEVGH